MPIFSMFLRDFGHFSSYVGCEVAPRQGGSDLPSLHQQSPQPGAASPSQAPGLCSSTGIEASALLVWDWRVDENQLTWEVRPPSRPELAGHPLLRWGDFCPRELLVSLGSRGADTSKVSMEFMSFDPAIPLRRMCPKEAVMWKRFMYHTHYLK